MRCLFSSIAWKREQAQVAAQTLSRYPVAGIEATPGLFAGPLARLGREEMAKTRSFWEKRGLPLFAMQALLFGSTGLELFGSEARRRDLGAYLKMVFKVAGQLGIGPLVFGSPKNRRRGGLPMAEAFPIAVEFFARLAPYAAAEGCTLCIEANAQAYDCDFLCTHTEVAELIKAVGHEGLGLQVDTGVMLMNGETPEDLSRILSAYALTPAHVHISAPFLEPVANLDREFHGRLCALLKTIGYDGFISIEMGFPGADDVEARMADALAQVCEVYGGGQS